MSVVNLKISVSGATINRKLVFILVHHRHPPPQHQILNYDFVDP